MLHKRHFFLRFIGTLLLIGLLIAGGAAAFQAGQARGYMLGAAAAGTQLSAPPAVQPAFPGGMPGYFTPYGFHPMHFFPFFGIGLALLFFFAVGGMFRMMAFRHWMRHAHMEGHGPWGAGMQRCTGDAAGKKPGDTGPSEPPADNPAQK